MDDQGNETHWHIGQAKFQKISDAMLCEAVARAERGQIDADLERVR
ncbi:type II toxin-antitoxin system RelE/ParE family toxin [Rhizobium beringeri]